MSHKRSLDTLSTPLLGGPSKRPRHLSRSTPATPAASHIVFSTPLKGESTPYPTRPSDSPSNPFGRKRIQHLIRKLPPATLFSKHLPLRFQLIRRGSPKPRQGGVHRVVQTPLSYTFTHLRCLTAFLFGGLPGQAVVDEHVFEVKKGATMYSQLYRPGQVKSGQTWAKLSSSKNPYRYRMGYFNDDEESQEEEDQLSSDLESDDEEQSEDEEHEDWKWEDEEEYTLGHVWPKGPDISRVIVYHYSRNTQIHISIAQTGIPRRKGRSNTPYVFSGRGRVWLSPPPLPRPIFSLSVRKVKSPDIKRHPKTQIINLISDDDAEGDTEDDENQVADNEHTEDLDHELDPKSFNEPKDAFAKFLARYMGSIPTSPSHDASSTNFSHDAEYLSEGESRAYPSTPGLTRSSSTPSSPLPTSSPSRASVQFSDSETESGHEDEGGYLTLTLPALTPFPPKARLIRKRMERIEKQMGKTKNGKWLCARDEKPEDDEKDELSEGGDDAAPTKTSKGVQSKTTTTTVGGSKEEDMPEDWDPFGEEEEL